MKILSYKVFEGRNIYSHRKCIRFDVDLEGYSEIPSKDIYGFNENLLKQVPELYEHKCSKGIKGGFVQRMEEGTYLSHIWEHMMIAIQNRMGINVFYGKAREIEGDRYYVIIQYEYKNTELEIANESIALINALCNGNKFDLSKRLKRAYKLLEEEAVGCSTESIIRAAKKRGIPVLNMWDSGFYMLGYGKSGRRIESTIVDSTECTAVDLVSDKLMTKKLLKNQCVPVAPGGIAPTFLDALKEVESIGYPVVLKPRYGHHGIGVKLDLKNEKELMDAFNDLKKTCNNILIEKYYDGNDFRICMIDGKMVAASLRIPPYVVGDGESSVSVLLDKLNSNPMRGEDHAKPLTIVKIDDDLMRTLKKQDVTLESIPTKGRKVCLRENANLSTGGIAVDCTDKVCLSNIRIFERAARAVNLNICGIDVCHEDLSIPMEGKGIVMEINAAPGIRMHEYPYSGISRDVGEAIVNSMFSEDFKSIPLVSVTGTNGKTTTTRLIGHTLSLMGYNVGMTTTSGIYVGGKCIHKGDDTGYESAKTILMNRDVDAAVLETARGGIIKKGLCYDLADVGVITNITEDHLGTYGVNTIQEMACVKSLVVEAVKDDGYSIINGDDVVSLDLIKKAKGHIIIFSKDKNNPYIRDNIKNGEYGVYTNDGCIYAEKNKHIHYISDICDVPVTLGGILDYNIENVLAACSALIGLGIDYCMIAKGLRTFSCDVKSNPGRFNVFDVNGGKVVLDYGHNIEGYKAVIRCLKKIPHNKVIGVIGVPGDRVDNSISEVGRISGGFFDRIIIKEDADRRGRCPGEVADILNQGARSAGMNKKDISIILSEKDALSSAIDMMKAGDIVVMFFESFDGALEVVDKCIVPVDAQLKHKLG